MLFTATVWWQYRQVIIIVRNQIATCTPACVSRAYPRLGDRSDERVALGRVDRILAKYGRGWSAQPKQAGAQGVANIMANEAAKNSYLRQNE